MNASFSSGNLEEIRNLIIELDIKCPVSGTNNWTDVRQFNLMFKTQMGATTDGASDLFLRPETAQGIFVNFLTDKKALHGSYLDLLSRDNQKRYKFIVQERRKIYFQGFAYF